MSRLHVLIAGGAIAADRAGHQLLLGPLRPRRSSTAAAHAMLPTLGMGANLALRDARLVAEHLAPLGRDDPRIVDAIAASETQMREYTYPFMRMTLDHDTQFGGGGLAKIT